MSYDEADALMEDFERKWTSKHKHDFLHRMERKLNRKERYSQT